MENFKAADEMAMSGKMPGIVFYKLGAAPDTRKPQNAVEDERSNYFSSRGINNFDRTRFYSSEHMDFIAHLVCRLVSPANIASARVLDLGCGTGLSTIPLAERLPSRVTGADRSPQMIAKASKKSTARSINWDVQEASSLTYQSGHFDIVFLSHVLHLVNDPLDVLRECRRVLKKGGWLIHQCVTLEDNLRDLEHVFFPETCAIDSVRKQTGAQLNSLIKGAGFSSISGETRSVQCVLSVRARLERARSKSITVLELIDTAAHAAGMERFENHVLKDPNDPGMLYESITVNWAQNKFDKMVEQGGLLSGARSNFF